MLEFKIDWRRGLNRNPPVIIPVTDGVVIRGVFRRRRSQSSYGNWVGMNNAPSGYPVEPSSV